MPDVTTSPDLTAIKQRQQATKPNYALLLSAVAGAALARCYRPLPKKIWWLL